ncbi:MAG: TSUP family transporter [Thioalkalivibrionaceae bacterium]
MSPVFEVIAVGSLADGLVGAFSSWPGALDLEPADLVWVGLIFVWTGFVRAGLGFGGAALGLPLMLLVVPDPLLWLPVIGWHLLFFSAWTLGTRLAAVDWRYLGRAARWIAPAALVGVIGLVRLPNTWLLLFIYGISLFYGALWLIGRSVRSHSPWSDRALLVLGGYVAGTSLTGAPLMVAVFLRNVAREHLRNTLFVLWFLLVALKMAAFATLGVDLQPGASLTLLPIAAIGHVAGLALHERLVANEALFRRWIGLGLVTVSLIAATVLLLDTEVMAAVVGAFDALLASVGSIAGLRTTLAGTAMVLTVVVFWPYLRGIARGRVKPHVFSWVIWGVNTTIAFAATLAGGGGLGAWVIGFSALVTLAIATIAWTRRGEIHITRSDWAFFAAALAGIPVWLALDDPLAAIVLITAVEVLGFAPTFRKTWRDPHSESVGFYALLILRNALLIGALEAYSLLTLLFPVAMAAACLALIALMVLRRAGLHRVA